MALTTITNDCGCDCSGIILPQGLPGDNGTDGTDGTNGVSVVSATINGSRHLILTMSDSTTIDAGVVAYPYTIIDSTCAFTLTDYNSVAYTINKNHKIYSSTYITESSLNSTYPATNYCTGDIWISSGSFNSVDREFQMFYNSGSSWVKQGNFTANYLLSSVISPTPSVASVAPNTTRTIYHPTLAANILKNSGETMVIRLGINLSGNIPIGDALSLETQYTSVAGTYSIKNLFTMSTNKFIDFEIRLTRMDTSTVFNSTKMYSKDFNTVIMSDRFSSDTNLQSFREPGFPFDCTSTGALIVNLSTPSTATMNTTVTLSHYSITVERL